MLENIPSQSTITELLGQSLFEVWQALCSAIDEKYDMERLWNTGGKNWTYEYKYRRGGKTKMKGQNLKILGIAFLIPFANNMMKQKPTTTENG